MNHRRISSKLGKFRWDITRWGLSRWTAQCVGHLLTVYSDTLYTQYSLAFRKIDKQYDLVPLSVLSRYCLQILINYSIRNILILIPSILRFEISRAVPLLRVNASVEGHAHWPILDRCPWHVALTDPFTDENSQIQITLIEQFNEELQPKSKMLQYEDLLLYICSYAACIFIHRFYFNLIM